MHKVKRLAIAVVAAMISAPLLFWLFSEAVVFFEMASTGATSRAELGDDLGLGILLFIVALPATVIATLIVGALVWARTGRNAVNDEQA